MGKESIPSGDGEGWRGAPGCGWEVGEVPLLGLVYKGASHSMIAVVATS